MKNKWAKIGIVSSLVGPSVLTTLALGGCGAKDTTSEEHILDINDFHGACVGYGDDCYALNVSPKNPGILRVADTINTFKEQHPNTVVLSAGDNNSGDSFSTAYHGETTFKILSKMGVDYSAVGNHAFEWGLDYLTPGIEGFQDWGRTSNTKGNYLLAANILSHPEKQDYEWCSKEGTPEFERDYAIWKFWKVNFADPYKIIDIHGHPICLIGLTTKETRTDGKIDVVSSLAFIDYIAAVHYAKRFAREQLGDAYNSIEAFVLLTHVESDYPEGKPGEGAAVELAENIDTRVDAVISGHSHKTGKYEVTNQHLRDKKIWVGQAGTAGQAILDTELDFDDAKPVGERLTGVKMNILKPKIDTKDNDPESDDPEERKRAFEAANAQYESIIAKAKSLPDDHFLSQTYYEFVNQKASVNYFFTKPLKEGTVSYGEQFPAAKDKAALGHSYIWPGKFKSAEEDDYCLEQMGGWMNYAMIQGTNSLSIKAGNPVQPAVSFVNFDSITHEFVVPEGESTKVITQGDMHQLQTYENNVIFGHLSIGQLWHIVDYALAGLDIFDYKNNKDYQSIPDWSDLEHDPVTDGEDECTKDDIPELKFACAPIQFWGMSFDVISYEQKVGEKFIRKYRVAYETKEINGKIVNVPSMHIYDPSSKMNDLWRPKSWMSAEAWLSKEDPDDRLIPVVLSSFVYSGGNHQYSMFKPYLEFNGRVTKFDFFTRDAMIEFCQGEAPTSELGYDLNLKDVHETMNIVNP